MERSSPVKRSPEAARRSKAAPQDFATILQSTVLEFSTANPRMILLLVGAAFICWTQPGTLQQLRGGAGRLVMSKSRGPRLGSAREVTRQQASPAPERVPYAPASPGQSAAWAALASSHIALAFVVGGSCGWACWCGSCASTASRKARRKRRGRPPCASGMRCSTSTNRNSRPGRKTSEKARAERKTPQRQRLVNDNSGMVQLLVQHSVCVSPQRPETRGASPPDCSLTEDPAERLLSTLEDYVVTGSWFLGRALNYKYAKNLNNNR